MAKIIFQIIRPGTSYPEFMKFDLNEIKIGRGLDNDLIVNDPFVSSCHLVLRFKENGWRMEDQNSVNGVFVKKISKVVREAELLSGDEIKIGKTKIRIFNEGHPVGAAKPMEFRNAFLKSIDNYKSLYIILLALIGISAMLDYLMSFEKLTLGHLLIMPVGILICCLIWASIWAFIGRVCLHKANLKLHMTICCFFTILIFLVGDILRIFDYLSSHMLLVVLIDAFISAALFALLLMGHLAVSTNLSFKTRTISSIGITSTVLFIVFLGYLSFKDEFHLDPIWDATLKPPFVKIIPSQDIDGFLNQTKIAFTKAAIKSQKKK